MTGRSLNLGRTRRFPGLGPQLWGESLRVLSLPYLQKMYSNCSLQSEVLKRLRCGFSSWGRMSWQAMPRVLLGATGRPPPEFWLQEGLQGVTLKQFLLGIGMNSLMVLKRQLALNWETLLSGIALIPGGMFLHVSLLISLRTVKSPEPSHKDEH